LLQAGARAIDLTNVIENILGRPAAGLDRAGPDGTSAHRESAPEAGSPNWIVFALTNDTDERSSA
jgi:hypothetical protein